MQFLTELRISFDVIERWQEVQALQSTQEVILLSYTSGRYFFRWATLIMLYCAYEEDSVLFDVVMATYGFRTAFYQL
jgi:hypothetical protein